MVGEKSFEFGGRVSHATNNQMELTAAIEALKYMANLGKSSTSQVDDLEIEIVSDSKYVILGITEWVPNWIKNNWRTAANKPVLNQELWKELCELNKELKPKWTYVKGHHENEYNNRADVIATGLAGGEKVELKNAQ